MIEPPLVQLDCAADQKRLRQAVRCTSVVSHCDLAIDSVRADVRGHLRCSLIEDCFLRLDWRWWCRSVPVRFFDQFLPVADFLGLLLGFCAVRFA